jgi:hypothetical protein
MGIVLKGRRVGDGATYIFTQIREHYSYCTYACLALSHFDCLNTDGDFCHQGWDTEIAQNIL